MKPCINALGGVDTLTSSSSSPSHLSSVEPGPFGTWGSKSSASENIKISQRPINRTIELKFKRYFLQYVFHMSYPTHRPTFWIYGNWRRIPLNLSIETPKEIPGHFGPHCANKNRTALKYRKAHIITKKQRKNQYFV